MEFAVPTAPYMQISYNKAYILVNGAMARDYSDKTCTSIDKVVVLFYKINLPETCFDIDVYFDGIKSMTTLDSIRSLGEYVSCIKLNHNIILCLPIVKCYLLCI